MKMRLFLKSLLILSIPNVVFATNSAVDYSKALSCLKEAKSKIDSIAEKHPAILNAFQRESPVNGAFRATNLHNNLTISEDGDYAFVDYSFGSGRSRSRTILYQGRVVQCNLPATLNDLPIHLWDLKEMDIGGITKNPPVVSFKEKNRSSESADINCVVSNRPTGLVPELREVIKAYQGAVRDISLYRSKDIDNPLTQSPLYVSRELSYPQTCREISSEFERESTKAMTEADRAWDAIYDASKYPTPASTTLE